VFNVSVPIAACPPSLSRLVGLGPSSVGEPYHHAVAENRQLRGIFTREQFSKSFHSTHQLLLWFMPYSDKVIDPIRVIKLLKFT